jgi:hypothetical protein
VENYVIESAQKSLSLHKEQDMKLRASTLIAADPDLVWGHVADFANDPTWRTAVIEMTPDPPGPAQVGQAVHEVLVFQGSTYVTDTRVTSVHDRHLEFEGAGEATSVRGTRSVSSEGAHTRVTLELTVRLRGPRRLLEPVMGVMYRRLVRSDLERLAELLASVRVA